MAVGGITVSPYAKLVGPDYSYTREVLEFNKLAFVSREAGGYVRGDDLANEVVEGLMEGFASLVGEEGRKELSFPILSVIQLVKGGEVGHVEKLR